MASSAALFHSDFSVYEAVEGAMFMSQPSKELKAAIAKRLPARFRVDHLIKEALLRRLADARLAISILICLASFSLQSLPPANAASIACAQTAIGQTCAAGIPLAKFQLVQTYQAKSNWCWAASLSMLFRYAGFPTSQQTIVRTVYGGFYDNPLDVRAFFSRDKTFTDDVGEKIVVHLDPITDLASAGNALALQMPVLYTTTHHAIVQTAVQYVVNPDGSLTLNGGHIFDPLPDTMGGGSRYLTSADVLNFAQAWTVRFTKLPSTVASQTDGPEASFDAGIDAFLDAAPSFMTLEGAKQPRDPDDTSTFFDTSATIPETTKCSIQVNDDASIGASVSCEAYSGNDSSVATTVFASLKAHLDAYASANNLTPKSGGRTIGHQVDQTYSVVTAQGPRVSVRRSTYTNPDDGSVDETVNVAIYP